MRLTKMFLGELIGRIVEDDPFRKFSGYTDPKATEKKVIKDGDKVVLI